MSERLLEAVDALLEAWDGNEPTARKMWSDDYEYVFCGERAGDPHPKDCPFQELKDARKEMQDVPA